jgi:hypothetical protein
MNANRDWRSAMAFRTQFVHTGPTMPDVFVFESTLANLPSRPAHQQLWRGDRTENAGDVSEELTRNHPFVQSATASWDPNRDYSCQQRYPDSGRLKNIRCSWTISTNWAGSRR